MNVQIKVIGLGKVDFVSPIGWIRDPSVELCGVDDDDKCVENVGRFFDSISPVPFENLTGTEGYVDAAKADLENALRVYQETQDQVIYSSTIFISIIPIAKYSKDI